MRISYDLDDEHALQLERIAERRGEGPESVAQMAVLRFLQADQDAFGLEGAESIDWADEPTLHKGFGRLQAETFSLGG